MELEKNQQDFLDGCKEASKVAFSFNNPLIVHHHDADGVSAGAIVVGSLIKKNKKHRVKCIKKLDNETIESLSREKELIFVDLGGGNPRVNELKDVVIIDHHQTGSIEKLQVNPLLYGIDGNDELSASGTAYCVFREYVDLGIVGAVGDMQSPLHGMNRFLIDEGVKNKTIKLENDLCFYGRYCRPLVQFLTYSDDPYIPMISYREERARALLSDLNIKLEDGKKTRVYADLTKDEKKRLISAITKLLITINQQKKAKQLIAESYIFPKRPKNELYEANEFSTVLNACGRHGRSDIGLSICLGKQDAYSEGKHLLQKHRTMLKQGVGFGSKNIQDLGKFYFLDARGKIDESIIGTVCGMVFVQKWQKPIIGVSFGEQNTIKFSSRASKKLVEQGLNLADIMKSAAAEVGGIGGGHKIAAGASIPKDRLNEFLLVVGKYFG